MHTCVSLLSLVGFETETIFSDSEDKLFAVGLSVWQLKQRHTRSLYDTMMTLISVRNQSLKCID